MRRREALSLIGAAALTPLSARAQQQATPVIGWLSAISEPAAKQHLASFSRGLGENGFVSGRNVAIEYRWADGQYDRLPAWRPISSVIRRT